MKGIIQSLERPQHVMAKWFRDESRVQVPNLYLLSPYVATNHVSP